MCLECEEGYVLNVQGTRCLEMTGNLEFCEEAVDASQCNICMHEDDGGEPLANNDGACEVLDIDFCDEPERELNGNAYQQCLNCQPGRVPYTRNGSEVFCVVENCVMGDYDFTDNLCVTCDFPSALLNITSDFCMDLSTEPDFVHCEVLDQKGNSCIRCGYGYGIYLQGDVYKCGNTQFEISKCNKIENEHNDHSEVVCRSCYPYYELHNSDTACAPSNCDTMEANADDVLSCTGCEGNFKFSVDDQKLNGALEVNGQGAETTVESHICIPETPFLKCLDYDSERHLCLECETGYAFASDDVNYCPPENDLDEGCKTWEHENYTLKKYKQTNQDLYPAFPFPKCLECHDPYVREDPALANDDPQNPGQSYPQLQILEGDKQTRPFNGEFCWVKNCEVKNQENYCEACEQGYVLSKNMRFCIDPQEKDLGNELLWPHLVDCMEIEEIVGNIEELEDLQDSTCEKCDSGYGMVLDVDAGSLCVEGETKKCERYDRT